MAEGISEESKKLLDAQVRKGKACKFLLLCKSASIETLIVFKKGAFGPQLMKAKKDGFKGTPHYGVVTGAGANLYFQFPGNGEVAAVMKCDAWVDKPPAKVAKMREFLQENDLKLKASFYVINDLQYAVDPDRDSDVPIPPPPPGCEVKDEAGDESVESGAPGEPTAPPPTGSSETDRPVETDRPAEVKSPDSSRAVKLIQALQQLRPRAESAAVRDPAVGQALLAAVGQIEAEIKAMKLDEAQAHLVTLAARLNSSTGPSTSSSQEDDPNRRRFDERRAALEPLLLKAQAADREKSLKLGAVWQMALEKGEDGGYAAALKAFDALEQAIAGVLKATEGLSDAQRLGIREGIVADMRDRILNAKVRWDAAIESAAAEIRKVQDGVREADPQLADELDRYLSGYVGRLDAIAVRCKKPANPELVEQQFDEARRCVEELLAEVKQDVVIDFVDTYHRAKVALRKAFDGAFKDLEKELRPISN